MKYFNFSILLFVFITVLASCSSNQTISFINEEMDLRDYETYRLITVNTNEEEFSVDGMVFFSQLEKTITENMDLRLFKPTNNPDLIVRYELVSGQRTQTSQSSNYYNPYSYYSPMQTRVTSYIEGILIIEFRDRKRKKLVWQASLDLQLRQGEPDKIIVEAVNEIFETYPYQAGSYEKIMSLDKK